MPEEEQAFDLRYRIKSEAEAYERNVLECQLSSTGVSTDELGSRPSPERRNTNSSETLTPKVLIPPGTFQRRCPAGRSLAPSLRKKRRIADVAHDNVGECDVLNRPAVHAFEGKAAAVLEDAIGSARRSQRRGCPRFRSSCCANGYGRSPGSSGVRHTKRAALFRLRRRFDAHRVTAGRGARRKFPSAERPLAKLPAICRNITRSRSVRAVSAQAKCSSA